jgi:hypothetical protein
MEKHETEALSIERPKDWNVDTMEMMGFTILVASSADVKAESFMGAGDGPDAPSDVFGDAPGVLLMAMPDDMAAGEGFTAEEIKSLPEDEPGVTIISQGEVTVNGVAGYYLSAEGKFETMGGDELGVYTGVLEHGTLPLMFVGVSPQPDKDKNLDIFKYMFESIEFN